uniref:Uncharacterized protein n=1 Tax=Vombatus ursinus TaxID=29139 RepID=A0A4X2JVP0_VOMUR
MTILITTPYLKSDGGGGGGERGAWEARRAVPSAKSTGKEGLQGDLLWDAFTLCFRSVDTLAGFPVLKTRSTLCNGTSMVNS